MKETGIIMSGNHPKLIMDGSKTMTRRTWGLGEINKNPDDWNVIGQGENGYFIFRDRTTGGFTYIKCPYGQVGDRLWVRETWALTPEWDDGQAPCEISWFLRGTILFKADMNWEAEANFKQDSGKWRSALFMPRWASRITLEITELRAERLQEITIKDALAEGTKCRLKQFGRPIGEFMELWDSLNAKRGYGWEVNPWVWVISFGGVGVRLK